MANVFAKKKVNGAKLKKSLMGAGGVAKYHPMQQKEDRKFLRANKRREHTLDATKGWKSGANKHEAESQIQEKVNLGQNKMITSVGTSVSHQIKVKTSVVTIDLRKSIMSCKSWTLAHSIK